MKYFVISLLCLIPFSFLSSQKKHILMESDKIKFLLNELDKPEANIRFIRNGEEFSGKEAREHMQKKRNYAKDKIKTVDDFFCQASQYVLKTDRDWIKIHKEK